MVWGEGLMSGGTILILSVVIAAIYILIEIKRVKHKIFALFLIGLIIVMYFGAVVVFDDKEVDLKTQAGLIDATKVYFSWMVSVTKNLGTITSNAIKMDWKSYNESAGDSNF